MKSTLKHYFRMCPLVGSDVWNETDEEAPKARRHGALRWIGRIMLTVFEWIRVIFHEVGSSDFSTNGLSCC